MYYAIFLASFLVLSATARIENDEQLLKAANELIPVIGVKELAELSVDEERIRQPFMERRVALQKALDDWDKHSKANQVRMSSFFNELNLGAATWLQDKKNELLQQPHFVVMRTEIEGIEKEIANIKDSESFQTECAQAIQTHQNEITKARQAYDQRMKESERNRKEGRSWHCNDGRYHQEHLATLSWCNPENSVRYRFGLPERERNLAEKQEAYDNLISQICPSLTCVVDHTFYELRREGDEKIKELEKEISVVDREEKEALKHLHQRRNELRRDFREKAIQHVLDENDREHNAMNAIMLWLDSFTG